jgi:23S rRNA (cytidine1920-2'-O)/16S rRNA (cytidine1409-2'-O)-methyltransferase
MNKERLDQLLVKKGLFETHVKAQAAIMAGIVYVDDQKIDKAGTLIQRDAKCEVRGDSNPYVSRGGLKLERALDVFKIDAKDRTVLDVGASTGGFTDCLLQKGAKKAYAIDVGYGLIALKLRNDPRVIVVERTNVRNLRTEELYRTAPSAKTEAPSKASLAVIDVSFISLAKVLPAIFGLLSDDGEIVALVKPQFEAMRDQVEKGGLVKDKNVQAEVLNKVVASANKIGLKLKGATYSPIKGADGNVEFFVHLTKLGDNAKLDANKVIAEAQEGAQ